MKKFILLAVAVVGVSWFASAGTVQAHPRMPGAHGYYYAPPSVYRVPPVYHHGHVHVHRAYPMPHMYRHPHVHRYPYGQPVAPGFHLHTPGFGLYVR